MLVTYSNQLSVNRVDLSACVLLRFPFVSDGAKLCVGLSRSRPNIKYSMNELT